MLFFVAETGIVFNVLKFLAKMSLVFLQNSSCVKSITNFVIANILA